MLWDSWFAFPLQRLQELITEGVWSDPESERIWKEFYPDSNYQRWTGDPTSDVIQNMSPSDVEMHCPRCSHLGVYVIKSALLRCSSCVHEFDASSLSAHYLKRDLAQWASTKERWYSSLVLIS